jgi:hypothetical protein
MLMMQMSESTAACSKHFISSLFERQKWNELLRYLLPYWIS